MKTEKLYILLDDDEPFNDDCRRCDEEGNSLTPIVYSFDTRIVGIFKTLAEAIEPLDIEVTYSLGNNGETIATLKDSRGISANYNADITLWDAFQDFYHIKPDDSLKGYRLYCVDKSVGFMDILG